MSNAPFLGSHLVSFGTFLALRQYMAMNTFDDWVADLQASPTGTKIVPRHMPRSQAGE